MNKIEIYYFSGTGNSLHAARELAKRLPGAVLIPIMSVMKEETIRSRAETVGLVFPIHAFTIPIIFKEFLKKADFSTASYMFALSTRRSDPRVFTHINRVLKGRKLDACFAVEMPQNYIPVFEVDSAEKIAECESNLREKMDTMVEVITGRQPYREEKLPLWVRIIIGGLFPPLTLFMHLTRYTGLQRGFYADEKCTGCGVCEKVCISGKIGMRDDKPVWSRDTQCAYCLACLHYCPAKAIQIRGKRTGRHGRYHHPDINPHDIAAQKRPAKEETA